MHIYNMSVTKLNILKAVGGAAFTRYALLQHKSIDSICTVVENWLSLKGCKFVNTIFLQVNSYARLQYVCNISAKY